MNTPYLAIQRPVKAGGESYLKAHLSGGVGTGMAESDHLIYTKKQRNRLLRLESL